MTEFAKGTVSTVVQAFHQSDGRRGPAGGDQEWWKLDGGAHRSPDTQWQRKEIS